MISEALEIAESPEAAASACAAWLLAELRELVTSGDRATLAVSGGSTPKLMFRALARAQFPWSKVHFFWVDERCVPPTEEQSNFKMADETFLRPAGIPAENVHRVLGELSPDEAAARYTSELKEFFRLNNGELPAFDIIHRGMGSDAHTASLFPGEPLIADRTGLAAAVYVDKLKSHRVTLLPGVLLHARKTVILAAGEDKADALFHVLRGPEDPFRYPCQLGARGATNSLWFIDRAAAEKL